ncbi:hypothetical protein ACET3Z_007756 [Daucus carota]
MPPQLHPTAATSTAITVHRAAAKPRQPPPENTTSPKLTTSLYQTEIGLFALTWSKNVLSRSLHVHYTSHDVVSDQSFPSFTLHLKPFLFWKKHGSRKLAVSPSLNAKNPRIFYDFSNAKFGSRPEPESGFYIAVVLDGDMILLIGDSQKQAYSRTKSSSSSSTSNPNPNPNQSMILKREHVRGAHRVYATKATFGDKTRNILVDCRLVNNKSSLILTIDNKRVLRIKHLEWKFRGNERIQVDGIQIQVSWDVHDWLFDEKDKDDGHALFMFKFEKLGFSDDDDDSSSLWSQQRQSCGIGYEARKLKKGVLTSSTSSCSSSSLSSASSNSVMEWESIEENQLKLPSGFSLLLYAWKN